MLELKAKKELAKEAHTLAKGNEMVRYRNITYLPVDYETPDEDQVPDPERTMWLPLRREDIRRMAAERFNTLFSSDSELSSFDFMVAQNARHEHSTAESLLVRTSEGLKLLGPDGQLADPTGGFVPNTIQPLLNPDPEVKREVVDTITEWVDGEEDASSLLHHLATALAPGWSAVKYVLLIGEGRNGKSVLLKMLMHLLGRDNVSTVTRQQIAEQNPVVTELNGKLVNIVFDGKAEYLKDSGAEKSLVAGEPVPIRKLYESTPTMVQTNALFIEGLNREPKSGDKSSALQKRLIRYQFPHVYALDHGFEKRMLSDEVLGAFLSVLVDHYVPEPSLAVMLAPTAKALELQLEHMFSNSVALQFLKYLDEHDTLGLDSILGEPMSTLVQMFQSWRVKENDLGTWAEPDVTSLFHPLLNTERRSARVGSTVRKVRIVTSLKTEAQQFLETLEGDEDEATVVAD
jgi:hypothetical protein